MNTTVIKTSANIDTDINIKYYAVNVGEFTSASVYQMISVSRLENGYYKYDLKIYDSLLYSDDAGTLVTDPSPTTEVIDGHTVNTYTFDDNYSAGAIKYYVKGGCTKILAEATSNTALKILFASGAQFLTTINLPGYLMHLPKIVSSSNVITSAASTTVSCICLNYVNLRGSVTPFRDILGYYGLISFRGCKGAKVDICDLAYLNITDYTNPSYPGKSYSMIDCRDAKVLYGEIMDALDIIKERGGKDLVVRINAKYSKATLNGNLVNSETIYVTYDSNGDYTISQ